MYGRKPKGLNAGEMAYDLLNANSYKILLFCKWTLKN